jgi:hypothetical protein
MYYGSSRTPLDLDDTTLRHLEAIVVAKLRRSEPFMLTVEDATAGRISVWVHATSDLHCSDEAVAPFEPDREVLERYMRESATPTGLVLSSPTDAR